MEASHSKKISVNVGDAESNQSANSSDKAPFEQEFKPPKYEKLDRIDRINQLKYQFENNDKMSLIQTIIRSADIYGTNSKSKNIVQIVKILLFILFSIAVVIPNLALVGNVKDAYDTAYVKREISFLPNELLKSYEHRSTFEISKI